MERTDVSSLFSLGGGGSATPPKVSRLLQSRFPKGYPGTGWGLTETNAIGTSFTGKPFTQKPGSAGLNIPVPKSKRGMTMAMCCLRGSPVSCGLKHPLW